LIASSSGAIGDRVDITANVNNSPKDSYVTVNYDHHWNHPSAKEENKDEDPSRQVVGEVVEAASSKESFRHIFTDSEKGQRSEKSGVEPG